MNRQDKQAIVSEHRSREGDTGSSEVQIAIFSRRIRDLTEHLKEHKSDHDCRRSLLRLVGRRRRLLAYLKREDAARHAKLIENLGIRG